MQSSKKKKPHAVRKKKGRPPKPVGHISPSKQYPKKRCGARTREGKKCQGWAMKNGRCRMHGGSSPKGEKHPRFKTGLHSKYFRETLKELLCGEKQAAEDIASLDFEGMDDEVRMAAAILRGFAKRRPEEVTPDWFVKAMGLVDNLAKTKERRLKAQKQLSTISVEELQSIIRRYTILVYSAVEKTLKNKKLKETLLARLQNVPEQVALTVGT